MSGNPFPFIMAFLGLIDGLLGLAFFLLKAALWLIPIAILVAAFLN